MPATATRASPTRSFAAELVTVGDRVLPLNFYSHEKWKCYFFRLVSFVRIFAGNTFAGSSCGFHDKQECHGIALQQFE